MGHELKVLYVDDSETQLEAVAAALAADGHTVVTAADVKSAEPLVRGNDLVLVDYHMPDTDGAAALVRLRKRLSAGDRTLFYLYTSDADVATRYKALGFDGAFTRKGSLADLVPQVRTAARLIHMRRLVTRVRE